MQRHRALVPLSHDHHHGLVAAVRLKQGKPAYNDSGSIAESVERLWRTELAPHFAQEEEILFTLEYSADVRRMIDRALDEHRRMRELVVHVEEGIGENGARAFGELLESHIRMEERELFPAIQEELIDGVMEEVGRKIATRRG